MEPDLIGAPHMVRWVVAWLAGAAAIVGVARVALRPVQESWMVVGASADESVFVAQFSVGNTGLFDDQLTTRVTLLRDDGSPVAYRSIEGPAKLDDEGVHHSLDALEWTGSGFAWRVTGTDLRSRGDVSATRSGCPEQSPTMNGLLHLPDEVGSKGNVVKLRGPAIVTRTVARGNVSGGALYAFDQRGVLGLDPLGTCPGFLVLGGATDTGTPPWIPPNPEENFELNFAGHTIQVRVGRHELEERAADTTLLPERWLAAAAGYRVPSLRLVRARIRVDELPAWSGVLVLRSH